MPQSRSRVVGSAFSTLSYAGQVIAFLQAYIDSGQQAVAEPEAIQPLGERNAVEWATARAIRPGTMAVTITELWNEEVWWQFFRNNPLNTQPGDIVAVWEAMAAAPQATTMQTLVKPAGSSTWRGKQFHNCLITRIPDGDTVNIGAMTVDKNVTIGYTHTTPLVQAASAVIV